MSKEEKRKEEVITELRVLKELPTQEITKGKDDEGNEYEFVTTEEAIKEILIKIREIHKAL